MPFSTNELSRTLKDCQPSYLIHYLIHKLNSTGIERLEQADSDSKWGFFIESK
jgi:hypothetical protein